MVGPNTHTSPAAKPVLDVLAREALTLKTYKRVLEALDVLTHGPKGQDLHFQDATGPTVDVSDEVLAEAKNPRIGRIFVPPEAGGAQPQVPEHIEVVQYNDKGINIFNADRNVSDLGRIIGHMSFRKESEVGGFNGEVFFTDAAEIALNLECHLQSGQPELEREIGFFSNRVGLNAVWDACKEQAGFAEGAPFVIDGPVSITEPIGKEIQTTLSVFGRQ